jgi:hypothetical protein
MSFGENRDDQIDLSALVQEQTDTALSLRYRVRNRSESDAYLVNRLFRLGAQGPEVDPGLVYITREDDGGVTLRKQMLPVPDHVKVETPELPYVTRLAAGGIFEETLRVGLPLVPYSPYESAQGPVGLGDIAMLRLTLGYVIADTALDVREVKRPDGTYLRIAYEELSERQCLKVIMVRGI